LVVDEETTLNRMGYFPPCCEEAGTQIRKEAQAFTDSTISRGALLSYIPNTQKGE